MYNVAYNKGHTESESIDFLSLFSSSQSLICESLFPQVYAFLASFISLSVSTSSFLLRLCLVEYSHHTWATDLTGKSFNVFQ